MLLLGPKKLIEPLISNFFFSEKHLMSEQVSSISLGINEWPDAGDELDSSLPCVVSGFIGGLRSSCESAGTRDRFAARSRPGHMDATVMCLLAYAENPKGQGLAHWVGDLRLQRVLCTLEWLTDSSLVRAKQRLWRIVYMRNSWLWDFSECLEWI